MENAGKDSKEESLLEESLEENVEDSCNRGSPMDAYGRIPRDSLKIKFLLISFKAFSSGTLQEMSFLLLFKVSLHSSS